MKVSDMSLSIQSHPSFEHEYSVVCCLLHAVGNTGKSYSCISSSLPGDEPTNKRLGRARIEALLQLYDRTDSLRIGEEFASWLQQELSVLNGQSRVSNSPPAEIALAYPVSDPLSK